MGKSSATDSDEIESIFKSVEQSKKKKKLPSILKHKTNKAQKKNCKFHSRTDDSDTFKGRSRLSSSFTRFISKVESTSEEEDDSVLHDLPVTNHKFLIGKVPRLTGTNAGKGSGLVFLVHSKDETESLMASQLGCDETGTAKASKWLKRRKSS